MRRLFRRGLAAFLAVAATAAPGHLAAQPASAALTPIVGAWVAAEADNFHRALVPYLTACISRVAAELPEPAQQTLVEAGGIDAGMRTLDATEPEALDQFLEGSRTCIRIAGRFGEKVLTWVFETQLPGAAEDRLTAASYCIIDVLLPLDDPAQETLFFAIDFRGGDLRNHGFAAIAEERPELAAELVAGLDACLTE